MVQQENIHSGRSNSQLGSRSRCRRCNLTSLLIHALSRSGSNPATVNFKSGQVGSETGQHQKYRPPTRTKLTSRDEALATGYRETEILPEKCLK